ncbi:MAG: plastocyanin/azurin family copper-binding protein [Chitinispirillaceae bacterium]|jgi:plastocyanin
MEKKCFCRGRFFAGALLAIMLLAGEDTWAHTQVVNFGGSLGLVFSPSSFTARVGDTVTWVGDFTMHTTTSTSVPAGAATWNFGPTSATSFSYAIKVAGTYNYECAIHVSLGMVGSFTASSSAVIGISPSPAVERTAIIGGTATGKAYIRFNVSGTRQVSLSIMDLRGRTLATIMDRTLTAGTYTLPLDRAIQSKGIYYVTIQGLGGTGREVFPVSIL